MDLATLQRHLLNLIKGTASESDEDDPYLYLVQRSKHLEVMQRVIFLWRTYGIGQYCVFTTTLLKRKGIFDETIQTFTEKTSISPFIEKLGQMFLEEMGCYPDPTIASLAQFELVLLRIKQGDTATYIIEWKQDPYRLLKSLLDNTPLEETYSSNNSFRTILSKELPGFFQVISLEE